MPQTSNELFLDAVLRHQVGLSRVSNDIQKKAFRLLNNTEKDLRSEIRQRLLNKPRGLPNPAAVRRMNRLAKSSAGYPVICLETGGNGAYPVA